MKMGHAEHDQAADIQMTPLIDAMFILVIFLLVTALLRDVHQEHEINLPEAGNDPQKAVMEDLGRIIEITRDNRFFIGGEEVSRNKLSEKIGELHRDDPDGKVRIDTDTRADAGSLFEVERLLRFYGLNNWGLRVRDR